MANEPSPPLTGNEGTGKNTKQAQRNNNTENVIQLQDSIIEGDKPPLVPEGNYELVFQYHKTGYVLGRAPKLMCYFKIANLGEYNGVMLMRYYNVKSLNSKARKGGSFRVSWKKDFVREYVNLFGLPKRLNRINTEILKTAIIIGKVRTVKEDYKGRPIPELLQYSVIEELTGIK